MSPDPSSPRRLVRDLWTVYDDALPAVYGYLLRRTGVVAVAEDLTSETFVGAIESIDKGAVDAVTTAWLVGIARHKLVDHWRRGDRDAVRQAELEAEAPDLVADHWDLHLDRVRANQVLAGLGSHHRAALTLRYLDGLPVGEVAAVLDRSVHATEALLVRARLAFRRRYEETS